MTGSARPNGQAIFALVLLVLTTVYASQIFSLGIPFARGVEPGASFLPILLSAIMYVGALRILISELRRGRREAADPGATSEHVPSVGIVGPLIVGTATALFTFALDRAGYFLSAGGYTFIVAFYFNYENSGRPLHSLMLSAMTAALITVFGWLFFQWLFELSLPVWSL